MYWRAKARSAPSNEFKSSTKGVKGEQYPLRHIQRDGATAATTPKYGAKLFVHARAAVRSRSIETAMRRQLRTTVMEPFLIGFLKTRYPRLGNYKTFPTVYLPLKSDLKWPQTKSAKRPDHYRLNSNDRFMIKGGNSINRYRAGSLPRYKYTYMYQHAQPRLDSSEHV